MLNEMCCQLRNKFFILMGITNKYRHNSSHKRVLYSIERHSYLIARSNDFIPTGQSLLKSAYFMSASMAGGVPPVSKTGRIVTPSPFSCRDRADSHSLPIHGVSIPADE